MLVLRSKTQLQIVAEGDDMLACVRELGVVESILFVIDI